MAKKMISKKEEEKRPEGEVRFTEGIPAEVKERAIIHQFSSIS